MSVLPAGSRLLYSVLIFRFWARLPPLRLPGDSGAQTTITRRNDKYATTCTKRKRKVYPNSQITPTQTNTMSIPYAQNEKSLPFITEEPLEGPAPDCSWNRIKNPQLRACVEPPTQFAEVLGYGVDGVTFKAIMGEKTCAVKVVSANHT